MKKHLPDINERQMVKAMTAALHPEEKHLYDILTEDEKPWYENFRQEIEENDRSGIVCSYEIPFN